MLVRKVARLVVCNCLAHCILGSDGGGVRSKQASVDATHVLLARPGAQCRQESDTRDWSGALVRGRSWCRSTPKKLQFCSEGVLCCSGSWLEAAAGPKIGTLRSGGHQHTGGARKPVVFPCNWPRAQSCRHWTLE
jgi:hypothetical protein